MINERIQKGVFNLYFYFLVSFLKNYFYFQKIKILKICFVWLLFRFISNYILYHSVFILPRMKFLVSRDFIISSFWFVWKNIFIENENKSNQRHFHHYFLFSVKMKTENNQIKHPLHYWHLVVCSFQNFCFVPKSSFKKLLNLDLEFFKQARFIKYFIFS